MPVKKKVSKVEKKDPNIVALFAIGAMFVIGLPSLVYLYIGNSRKALVYTVALIGGSIAMIVGSFVLGILTFGIGLLLLFPAFFIILLLEIAIVFDVYKLAKGEKGILPNF